MNEFEKIEQNRINFNKYGTCVPQRSIEYITSYDERGVPYQERINTKELVDTVEAKIKRIIAIKQKEQSNNRRKQSKQGYTLGDYIHAKGGKINIMG